MDLLAKSLMYARRKQKIKKTGFSISDHEIFGVIINRIKITGGFINTIRDMIQGGKLWNIGTQEEDFRPPKTKI